MGRSNNIILQNKRIEKKNYNKKEKDKKDGQSRYIDLFGDKEKRNRGKIVMNIFQMKKRK